MVYIAAMGSSYWVNFIWYYLVERWGTQEYENLIYNAGFGLFYFLGCMFTAWAVRRYAARSMLQAGYAVLIGMTIFSGVLTQHQDVALIIAAHAFVVAWTWPNLEMLVTAGYRGKALGRSIGRYNIAWALTSAVSFAIAGKLYNWHPATLFAIPCACWVLAIAMVRSFIPEFGRPDEVMPEEDGADEPELTAADREITLVMKRLSRLGNMASYVMLSTLIPILPAVTRHQLGLELGLATAMGSIWGAFRVVAFFGLGKWHGWHFKPKLFLGVMLSLPVLFAFVVVSRSIALVSLAQVALGLAVGFIYMSSLFYSLHGHAETSEAAYHEAGIGLGMLAGPLLAAAGGFWAGKMGYTQTHVIAPAVAAILLVIWARMYWQWSQTTRVRAS